MPSRNFSADKYRYGFNGKEKEANNQDYGFRIYNPRVAKFLSVDPLANEYPELTPYQFASNIPTWGTDIDGLELAEAIISIGMRATAFMDQKADVIKSKVEANPNYQYSAAEKIQLFVNGLSKTTPFGTIHQLDKQVNAARQASPEQQKVIKTQAIEQAKGMLVSMVVDMANGRAPGQTAVAKAFAPTVNNAIQGDPEAIGEVTGTLFMFYTPFKYKSSATTNKAVAQGSEASITSNANTQSLTSTFLGGAKGSLLSRRNVLEGNHIPSYSSIKKAGLSVKYDAAAAIQMLYAEHRSFISTGSSYEAKAFRAQEASLLKQGKYMDAFELNANRLREVHGTKYDEAINMARDYYSKVIIQMWNPGL